MYELRYIIRHNGHGNSHFFVGSINGVFLEIHNPVGIFVINEESLSRFFQAVKSHKDCPFKECSGTMMIAFIDGNIVFTFCGDQAIFDLHEFLILIGQLEAGQQAN